MQMTQIVMEALKAFGDKYGIPVVNEIRTDATVPKATRSRKFLVDYDPDCKAVQDYKSACQQIRDLIVNSANGQAAA
jgi:nitrogenase subunit NifH